MNEKLINKNITKRILSIMLALLLWVYVITEQNPDITKDIIIPVKLVNTVFLEESNMILVSDPSSFKLTLKIKGKNKVLEKLNESTVEAVADMEGHRLKGDNFLEIKINGIPESVNILQKSSESLKVVLEQRVTTQKSVQINLMGNPQQGMAAMASLMVPSDVIIIGAESQIRKISSVRVDVDIAGSAGAVKKILPVRVLDENGKDISGITIDPVNVEVSIPVENTKRVSVEADLTGKPAEGHLVNSISAAPGEILIAGKPEVLAGINSIKTEKIDITGETADVSRDIRLVLPEGIELVNAVGTAKVTVDIEKNVTSEITISSFEHRNLAEGMKLDSIQGEVVASLKGAESRVADAAGHISFYVDLKNAVEGNNVIDVSWEAPEGIEVLSVLPHQVTVVLSRVVP
ncbi:MAG TPA: CdaR family protein [Clostridia bacterium]|nr:CdaR family protein [Clostridia bacterium]